MSKFDELIVSWRKEMSAAGIGPGPVRDELECHLRDGYDSRVRADMDPAAAFADAATKLGAPKALRQEYNTAVTRWTRLKRFLGRRVELLPTDMRVYAWAAIPAGTYDLYCLIQALYLNRLGFLQASLATPYYGWALLLGLSAFAILLFNLAGIFGSIRYLRRPAYSSARMLAWFWVWTSWVYLVELLMFVSGLSSGNYSRNGTLLPDMLGAWPLTLTLVVALLTVLDWTKRLRAAFPKNRPEPFRSPPDEASAP